MNTDMYRGNTLKKDCLTSIVDTVTQITVIISSTAQTDTFLL